MEKKTNIPGIYNWCDRWCENCTFTHRCAVYEKEARRKSEKAEASFGNQEFWDKLDDTFKETMVLLQKMMEKHGFDPESIPESEQEKIRQSELEIASMLEEHPLLLLAEAYADLGSNWIEASNIQTRFEEIQQQLELGIKNEFESEKKVIELKDCQEVIQFYLFFIPVKCRSALRSLEDKDFWDEFPVSERSYNGTAKIALIAIERSMQAWGMLLKWMPDEEHELIGILATLQKLCRLLETEFPEARLFVRPGFDE